jgi:hypothetical protein
MAHNLPLAFGALLTGGLVLQKGIEATKAGFTGASQDTTGTGTGSTAMASGTASKALALAAALVGSPYSVAEHADAINMTVAQVKQLGTDCSGYVSDLMGPNGLGIWSTAYATPGIPSAPGIVAGRGSQITLWNNAAPGAAGHVFIQFGLGNGQSRWFEDAGGIGAHEMSASEVSSYMASGAYQPYHPQGY